MDHVYILAPWPMKCIPNSILNNNNNITFVFQLNSFKLAYMYTLNHLTTLKNNQTKQINILNGQNVPYKKYYILNLREDKVNVVIEFANKKECGLGLAMPKTTKKSPLSARGLTTALAISNSFWNSLQVSAPLVLFS